MKKLILYMIPALGMVSCYDTLKDDLIPDPSAYITRTGIVEVVLYDIFETVDHQVAVAVSGIKDVTASVTISHDEEGLNRYNSENGKNLVLLPDTYYTIPLLKADINAAAHRAVFNVRFDVAALGALLAANPSVEFAVPLSLTGAGVDINEEQTFVALVPDVRVSYVSFTSPGRTVYTVVQETGTVVNRYSVGTGFNVPGDVEVEFEVSQQLLDEWNTANGTDYLPMPSEWYDIVWETVIPAGTSAKKLDLEVDKSSMERGVYAIPLSIKTVSSGYQINPSADYMLMVIDNGYPEIDKSRWTLFFANSYHSPATLTDENVYNMIDGSISTRWEARYNNNGYGEVSVPFIIDWEFEQDYMVRKLAIQRRSDQYVTDTKAGYFALSRDGNEWTTVQEFDFGMDTGVYYEWLLNEAVRARYLRVVVTEVNRTSGVYDIASIAEIWAFSEF